MDDRIIGLHLGRSPILQEAEEKTQGFLRSVSPVDGVARLTSFRSLQNYPLIVSAGFGEAEFMAETWARQRAYTVGAGLTTALLFVLASLVTLQSRAQERAHATLDEAARHLRASKTKLRDIAETASDWFWEMDADLCFAGVSGAYAGSIRDPELYRGRRCEDIALREAGDGAHWEEQRRILEDRQPFRDFEFAVHGPDGDTRIWSLSGKPVFDDQGAFAGYRGSGSDVTERRRLAGVARRSAESLLRLLDDILDFSKLEAGRIAIEEEACTPADLAEAVMAVFQPSAADKGLSLSCRMLPTVPEAVVTDPARLRQILFNLVGNAVKFTGTGHVAVRARRGADLPEGRFLLEFEVEDSGIGIAAESIPSLFDRFTQADSSITRRYGGTGLGLAICKELCGLLGGTISVTSAPGKGSLFQFSVACAPGDPAALRHAAEAPPAVPLPPLRVLAVDDNAVNRDIVRGLLVRGGHSVVTAVDGDEAVRTVERSEEPFDVVLMDIQMPGMDGLTATRLIRALPAPRNGVPVIALTAHASGSSLPECMAVGMNGFVPKPLRPAALDAAIRAVVGSPASKAVPTVFAEAAPESVPVADLLDREQVDSVAEALGPESWSEAVQGFSRTAREQVARISSALASGEEHRRAAHTLKGLSWNVGAKRLGDLALALEKAPPGEALALAGSLEGVLKDSVEALSEPL
ncbi:ATP-binding protein [Azospirillum argentinense]|uniref:histidine kinase n=1 Tax=Azospirillum argentinense TaxID=2970906 RepID=A0A5B0L021_9PROT|nr:ATP-binding protein [Azospirillum argentinense]KAA1057313.1 Sensory/regulatory protein RpfC [Azospirillum argentinense]